MFCPHQCYVISSTFGDPWQDRSYLSYQQPFFSFNQKQFLCTPAKPPPHSIFRKNKIRFINFQNFTGTGNCLSCHGACCTQLHCDKLPHPFDTTHVASLSILFSFASLSILFSLAPQPYVTRSNITVVMTCVNQQKCVPAITRSSVTSRFYFQTKLIFS